MGLPGSMIQLALDRSCQPFAWIKDPNRRSSVP